MRSFNTDFLNSRKQFVQDQDKDLIEISEYDELRVKFIKTWAVAELDQILDDEQARAVGAVNGNYIVTARAGSGKTRTLVTRSLFLLKHCHVNASELMLLAFNRDAADEMRNRIQSKYDGTPPHVMTFHALAYALVHPEETLVYDNVENDQLGQSKLIQSIIDEQVRNETGYELLRELMLSQFREDWERIVDGRFELPMKELLEHRRSLPRESLNGEYVKSYGEKLIANTLFEHGVEYRYESTHRWNGTNYRPDFQIFSEGRKIVVEYFGLEGDPDYDEMSSEKRKYWAAKNGWDFLEFTPSDIVKNGPDSFAQSLITKLKEWGVLVSKRSEEEIWDLVKERAIDGFTKAMRGFITRCRQKNLSPSELEGVILNHAPCTQAEELFLEVSRRIFADYCQYLESQEKQDFDGLMWRSVDCIQRERTDFSRDKSREKGDLRKLRFILVDEYQDFSEVFFKLVSSIKIVNKDVRLFCVGDDWQAINGFAGSDLVYFEKFEELFGESERLSIGTNYRSPGNVVKTGNALMVGMGKPARIARDEPGLVRWSNTSRFSPSPPEESRHNRDEFTPMILRQVRWVMERGRDVVLLTRRNGIPFYINYDSSIRRIGDLQERFLAHIRSFVPDDDRGKITISTVHKYKGLEQEAVIIIDANARSYPLIHSNWIYMRIFGDCIDKIERDEMRLFYVALTRAKEDLLIMAPEIGMSSFIEKINDNYNLGELKWEELASMPALEDAKNIVKVFDAFEIKEQLKKQNYRWNPEGKYWWKSMMEEGFSLDSLKSQAWAKQGYRIEVTSESGDVLHSFANLGE